jgi:glycerophosphoryl diester phosphodiesterase
MVVIAHRGAGDLAPDNTLAAVRKGIALGVDYLEADVQTTRDGRLVCSHDDTVDGQTEGSGRIREMTADEIRALDAGSKFSPQFAGERIPFFEEVLAACKGRVGVYVDVKDAAAEQIVAAIVEQQMADQVIIHVYRIEHARAFKRLTPALPVMVSPGQWATMKGFAALLTRDLGSEYLNSHVREWTAEAVEEAHRAGAKVWVDIMGDTDNEEAMRRIIAMGVDGMQTDRPDLLLRVLNRARSEE